MGYRSHVLSTQLEACGVIQDLARRDSYVRDVLRECDQRMRQQTKHFFLESEALLVESRRALVELREGDLICAVQKYDASKELDDYSVRTIANDEFLEMMECYILCAPFSGVKQLWF